MLNDPGKGKNKTQATTDRLKAWAKPKTKADRDKLRAERIADYERVHGPLTEAQKARKGGKQ